MNILKNIIEELLQARNQLWPCSEPTLSMRLFDQGLGIMFGQEADPESPGEFTQELTKDLSLLEASVPDASECPSRSHAPDPTRSADSASVSMTPGFASDVSRVASDLPRVASDPPRVASVPSRVASDHVRPAKSHVGIVGPAVSMSELSLSSHLVEVPGDQTKFRDPSESTPLPHADDAETPSHVGFHAMPLLPSGLGPTSPRDVKEVEDESKACSTKVHVPELPIHHSLKTPTDPAKAFGVSQSPMARSPGAHVSESPSTSVCDKPISVHAHVGRTCPESHAVPTSVKPLATGPAGMNFTGEDQELTLSIATAASTKSAPSHVNFQAMPHLPQEDVGPTPLMPAITTAKRPHADDTPSHAKEHKASPGSTTAYTAAGGISSFATVNPPSQIALNPIPVHAEPDKRVFSVPTVLDHHAADVAEAALSLATEVYHPSAPVRFNVKVGLVNQALHEVQVTEGTTVGQLSIAEGNLVDSTITWRPTDEWGIQIPHSQELAPEQVIFLSDAALQLPPCTCDQGTFPGVCRDAKSRTDWLWTQRGWVADDEMTFYLQQLHAWGLASTPPLKASGLSELNDMFEEWVLNILEQAQSTDRTLKAGTAVLFDHHWTPIKIHASQSAVHFHTTPLGRELLSGIPTPMSTIRAHAMRREFAEKCLTSFHPRTISVGGAVDEGLVKRLQALIEGHGVDPSRSATCATNLITNLGTQAVINTLAAPHPWKDLKVKASLLKPPIQIVLSDELQKAIAKRAQTGRPVGKKQTKKQHNHGKKPISLQSDQISVPSAIFQQQDGSQLSQISMHQINKGAKGIVVVNVQEALPFFQLNEPVSTEGIALLVLDHNDSRIPEKKQLVQFPAHYSDTNEPILVTAAMLQIGSKPVMRFRPESCVKVDEIETQVVRILAYRDQIKTEWAHMLEGPAAAAVLDLSGKDGVFSEPRTDSGRMPDPSYRVIWLPRRSFAEAALLNQTTTQASWLVRNGERFGLRVREEDAESVHQMHRPEISYLDGNAMMSYKVGPLPWGTTKSSLQKVFNQWQWNARPGQPQGQAADGVFWTAQATAHPSHWVFTMMHGDVLITHNDAIRDAKTAKESSVIASSKTLRQMTSVPSKVTTDAQVDWVFMSDPWAPKPQKVQPVLSQSQMAQMQSNIEQNLRGLLPSSDDTPMERAYDGRIQSLEDQVKQLSSSMTQLTGNVSTIHTQQHQLGAQVQKMKTQMDTQHASLHNMIDSKLEDQMSRIEALLSKKAKTSE
eukprot:s4_g62.t1